MNTAPTPFLGYPTEEQPSKLPHNLDAEQALLGALLFDNRIADRVQFLHPDMFFDPVHGQIFDVSTSKIAAGVQVDAVVLKSHFDATGVLDEIGGTTYLAVLMEGAVTGNAAVEYGRIVYDLHQRRELVRIADDMRHAAMADTEVNPAGIIEAGEASLFKLAEQSEVSRGFRSFKENVARSIESASAAYERGGPSGISTGLQDLDKVIGGLHPSDLIILGGRPSMGKTSLATNIAFSIAKAYQYEEMPDGTRKTTRGGVVGFYSLEMSGEQLASRIISDRANVPNWMVKQGQLNQQQFMDLRDAAIELNGIPLFVDDTGGLNIASLAARARRLKRTHGLDLIVVDYIQLVTGSRKSRSDGRVQEVSEITQQLKAIAKELDVPVLALSQLSRNVENRDDKKPQLSDLRESGSIEQDADVVLFAYREAYYKEREQPREDTPEYLAWEDEMDRIRNLAEVIVGKQRHGPIGTAKLQFDGAFTRFSDLHRGETS